MEFKGFDFIDKAYESWDCSCQLVILQPVLLNSTWQIVLAVMGLGMLAEGFNTRY